VVPLLIGLALVVAAAKAGGWLVSHLGQPSVLGELIVGLILGPSLLNLFGMEYLHAAHVGETIQELGELGVIFLMFTAGLEINISDFAKTGKSAVLSGVLGVLFPIGLGTAALLTIGYDSTIAVFVGLVLSATSVSISAQTLLELGFIRSREGLTLLGAAVVDDVLAIALLSAFTAIVVSGTGGIGSLVWIVVRMLLFLVGATLLAWWILPTLAERVKRLPVSEPVVSLAIVAVLTFAWASEEIGGVAAITGAFIVGVALGRSVVRHEIERGIHTLNYGLLVPMFLVSIGLSANIRDLSMSDLGLAAIVCLVAFVSKWIGATAGAKIGGMNWKEANRVGTGMISRGEVGLIVADVGLAIGIIQSQIFTIIVVMVLVTTLATPPLLRFAFRGKEPVHA
jgi:Kef-type K+ transport system membrane component KefB